jgi:hypothetical protein
MTQCAVTYLYILGWFLYWAREWVMVALEAVT